MHLISKAEANLVSAQAVQRRKETVQPIATV